MILPIIAFIITFVLMLRSWLRDFGTALGDWAFGAVIAGLMAIVGALAAFMIGMGVFAIWGPDAQYESQYTVPLVAMQDNTGVRGSFFLGSGGIGSASKYVYYYGTQETGYIQSWVYTDEAVVYEVPGLTEPRIEVIEDVRDTSKWYGIGFNDDPRYAFYIPVGSIVQGYNLDLEG
jgi:hypothetical protein